MIIDDSLFFSNPREKVFANLIDQIYLFIKYDSFRDENPLKYEKLIYVNMFSLSNEVEIHERVRTKFVTAIADLGGLYAVVMAIFASIYWLFVEPFRNLHLAVSFNRMKNQICRQEGLLKDQTGFDE